MRPIWSCGAVLAGAFVFAATAATVQADPPKGYYVLSVGVGKYKGDTESQLPSAKDAREFFKLFEEGKVPVRGRTLTDADATAKGIKAALREIQDKAKPDDFLVVYLAGHGAPTDTGGWVYLPHDFDRKDAAATTITDALLLEEADGLAARGHHVLLAVEACFSGLLATKAKALGLVEARRESRPGRGGLIVVTSSSSSQVSWAYAGHGLFTLALQDVVYGKADRNRDGVITLKEFRAYLKPRLDVARYTVPKYPGMDWPQQDGLCLASPEAPDGLELVRADPKRAQDPADENFVPPAPGLYDWRGPAPVGTWQCEVLVASQAGKPVKEVYTLTIRKDGTYTARLKNRWGDVEETKGTYEYSEGKGGKFVLKYGAHADDLQFFGRTANRITVRVQPDKSYQGDLQGFSLSRVDPK
jgi:hypothetical protein